MSSAGSREDGGGEQERTRFAPPHQSSPSIRAAPKAGDKIGKYVIERVIGHGGMGLVVAAKNEQLGEHVAIKLLHPKAAKDTVQAERFVREARATVRIKSEHVVRVLDAGTDERTGTLYLVMEYLEGEDVARVLDKGPMRTEDAVDTLMQVCEAVAAAHALGIIHRDLKPSNFFITRRADGLPLVKVLDFGISKAIEGETNDGRLTETQASFGSPTYMSPEQIRSARNADERSDVWSLGVAMFEMLTARLPFVADNVSGILASIVADPPFRIAAFAPEVPEELEATVMACLEKDPQKRIGSVSELADRLRPFASEDIAPLASRISRIKRVSSVSLPPLSNPAPPTTSRPSGPPVVYGTTGVDLKRTAPPPTGWSTRSMLLVGGLAALGALLLVAGLVAWRMRGRVVIDPTPAVVAVTVAKPVDAPASATPSPVAEPSITPSATPVTATATPIVTPKKRGTAPPAATASAKPTASPPPPTHEPPKHEPPKPATTKPGATDDRF